MSIVNKSIRSIMRRAYFSEQQPIVARAGTVRTSVVNTSPWHAPRIQGTISKERIQPPHRDLIKRGYQNVRLLAASHLNEKAIGCNIGQSSALLCRDVSTGCRRISCVGIYSR